MIWQGPTAVKVQAFQRVFTCSNLITEALQQGVEYLQSEQ